MGDPESPPNPAPKQVLNYLDEIECHGGEWRNIKSYQMWAPTRLTMPQPDPSLPPRPEFPPFIVPHLCASAPFDDGDLATYPERRGWVVHYQDQRCHMSCPPGICMDGVEASADSWWDVYNTIHPTSPMLSRADGGAVTAASKVAFFQSWLFFGTLREISQMCGCPTDVHSEFVVHDGQDVSTAALNGLAGRWFTSLDTEKVGDKLFLERVFVIARRIVLLLRQELSNDAERKPVFRYTPDQVRVLFSIDILFRALALHLLLHITSPALADETMSAWMTALLYTRDMWIEGQEDLARFTPEIEARGWCKSECGSLRAMQYPDLFHFISVLDRPLAKNHSACGDVVCSAYQVDEATYVTTHIPACSDVACSQDFVGVSAEDLVERLKEDQIPVVIITDDLQIRVVSGNKHPYIALSHVCEYYQCRVL